MRKSKKYFVKHLPIGFAISRRAWEGEKKRKKHEEF